VTNFFKTLFEENPPMAKIWNRRSSLMPLNNLKVSDLTPRMSLAPNNYWSGIIFINWMTVAFDIFLKNYLIYTFINLETTSLVRIARASSA
jgi:hypothetical protein